MHPDLVREYVAASYSELRARLDDAEELRVTNLALEDDVRLFIGFTHAERPVVDHALAGGIVGPNGLPIAKTVQVPLLGTTPKERDLVLCMDFDDFDFQPPSAELLLPDRSPLPDPEWPAVGRGGIVRGHPSLTRPWFCRRGLREYHSHPQHEDDPWDRYREGSSMANIVCDLLRELTSRWTGVRVAS